MAPGEVDIDCLVAILNSGNTVTVQNFKADRTVTIGSLGFKILDVEFQCFNVIRRRAGDGRIA